MNKPKLHALLILAAGLAAAVAAWLLLPAQVALQIGSGGAATNFAPKPLAVLLPLIFSITGAGMLLSQKAVTGKAMILGWAGAVLQIVTILINRMLG